MNTLQDLNNYGNTPVNYNSQADYSITFVNSGNASINVFQGQQAALVDQVNISNLVSAVRDIVITITGNTVPFIEDVTYVGAYGNISVFQTSDRSWQILGIRDINRFDEAMANTRTVIDFAANIGNAYSYQVDVNDQLGNNESYTITANVSTPYVLSPDYVSFSEDIPANLTILSIPGNVAGDYTLTFTVDNPALGQVANATAIANSVTISGNAATLNSSLSGNVIKFYPAGDSLVSTNFKFGMVRPSDGAVIAANVNIGAFWDGNSHADFTTPASITFNEDTPANLTGISITDLYSDYRATNYTIEIAAGNAAQGQIKYTGNGAVANSFTFTDTKTNLNSMLSGNSLQFLPAGDFAANSSVFYSQTRVVDGAVQVDDLAILMVIGNTHGEATVPSSITFNNNILANIAGIAITDQYPDYRSTNYTITIAVSDANVARIRFAGNSFVGNSVTLTNTKANLNALFSGNSFQFVPGPLLAANTEITYSQVRDADGQVQINNQSISMVYNTGSPLYALTTSYTFDEDGYFDLVYNPSDADTSQYFGNAYSNLSITLTQLTPNPATQPVYRGSSAWDGDTITASFDPSSLDPVSDLDGSYPNGGYLRLWAYPGYTGNMTFRYTQVKSYGNSSVEQANVVINANLASTHGEYNWSMPATYYEDAAFIPTYDLDYPYYGATYAAVDWQYKMQLQQISPDPNTNPMVFGWMAGPGNVIYANAASVVVMRPNPTNLNQDVSTIIILPPPDYTGNISVAYTSWREQTNAPVWPGNLIIANGVVDSSTIGNTHPEYQLGANITALVGNTVALTALYGYSVTDLVADATYSVTISQDTPAFGNFYIGNTSYGNTFSVAANSRANVNAILANLSVETNISSDGVNNAYYTLNRFSPTIGNAVLANAVVSTITLTEPSIGDYWQGGYVVGQGSSTQDGVATHWLIAAPKSGEVVRAWNVDDVVTTVANAWTGPENTTTLAVNAQNNAAVYCSNYSNDGYTDWYLPSQSDMQQVYVNLKSDNRTNATSSEDGTPVIYTNNFGVPKRTTAYTNSGGVAQDPAQTSLALFQVGNAQAFGNGTDISTSYHWTSTTYDPVGGFVNNPVAVAMIGTTATDQGGRFIMSVQSQADINAIVRPFRRVPK